MSKLPFALVAALSLLPALSAQAYYCAWVNGDADRRPLSGNVLNPDTHFALRVVAPRDLEITGFDLFASHRSASGTELDTFVWLDCAGKPCPTPVRRSKLKVGAAAAWYTSRFPQIKIAKGAYFYIGFRSPNDRLMFPILKNGDTATHYFGKPGSWQGPFCDGRWALRILCEGRLDAGVILTSFFTAQFDGEYSCGGALRSGKDPWTEGIGKQDPRTQVTLPDCRVKIGSNLERVAITSAIESKQIFVTQTIGSLAASPAASGGEPQVTYTANQARSFFPATLEATVPFLAHIRYGDLKPDRPLVFRHTAVTSIPHQGDLPAVNPRTTRFTDACTGRASLATMPLKKLHARPPRSADNVQTLLESVHTIRVAGTATKRGFVRLTVRAARGEPDQGALVASSDNTPVAQGRSATWVAAFLATSLRNNLRNRRGCCPATVTDDGATITIRFRSYHRFTCYLEGLDIRRPPYGIDLSRESGTNLGQSFTKSGSRRWLPLSPTRAKVTFFGRGCSFRDEPEPRTFLHGSPKLQGTMRVGLSMAQQNGQLPHLLLLGTRAVDVPFGTCSLYLIPDIILLLPPTRTGLSFVRFPVPNDKGLVKKCLHWQGATFSRTRVITSDRATTCFDAE